MARAVDDRIPVENLLDLPYHLDVGGRTYRVAAFHPSSVVVDGLDDAAARRIRARVGAGVVVLERADGVDVDRYIARVDIDGGIAPEAVRPIGRAE